MSFYLNEDESLSASGQERNWRIKGDRTDFTENLKAAYNYTVKSELSTSERGNLINKYGEIINTAEQLGHTNLSNPFVEEPFESEAGISLIEGDGSITEEDRLSSFHQKLDELQRTDPNLSKALKERGIDTQENIQKQIQIDVQDSFNKFIDVKSRATGTGTLGSFVGMGGAVFTDPIIAATIPISMGYSIPRGFVKAAAKIAMMEAIIAGAAEVAIQYGAGVGKYRESLGLENESLKRVGYATLAGGLGGPILFSVFKGLGKTIDMSAQGIAILRTKLEELPLQKIKAMYKEMAKKNPQFAKKDLDNFNPEQFTDDIPFEPSIAANKEHIVRSNEVADAVNETGKLDKVLETPSAVVKPKDINSYQSTAKVYDPDELVFEPEIFQYKTDGDKFGVSKKLEGVEEWSQEQAQTVVVYEFLDGRKAIVDGHQRLALAKRLKAKGQKPKLLAYTFREADGVLPEQMLVKGMTINLSLGTGTATDAAKVLRAGFGVEWNKIKKNLAPRSKIVRNAKGLSQLSDDAFGLLINKEVNEDLAALVGSLIENKKIHNKVLASLMNRRFANIQEMENVVNSIKNSPVVKSEQETLFGKDFIEESLFFEKAQLISYITTNKKRLKQAFQTIVKSDKDLTAAGNILKKEQNIEQGIENAKILEKLNILSTRVGQLSDDLNAAAKILKEGNKAEARDAAQQAIQRAVERGDFDGVAVSGPIRNDAAETPTQSLSRTEEPKGFEQKLEEAKQFDNIQNNTKGIEKQTNELDNQLFEPPPKKDKPKTFEDELENTIKSLDPETKIPGKRIIDEETGEIRVEETTIKKMLDDEAQDDAFIDRLKDCV